MKSCNNRTRQPVLRLHTFAKAIVIFLASFSTVHSHAGKIQKYQGTASSKGKVVYRELHTVEYGEAGEILSAETIYERINGERIALLKSDFRPSLTVPPHEIIDYRSGEIQGLRKKEAQIELYFKEKGKEEKSRVLSDSDFGERLLVGCQGLNYYLLSNLESIDMGKKLPLRFLIPGNLDYYDFDMKQIGDPKSPTPNYELSVKNWFLRLFAPKLLISYDRNLKRILRYEGISNIKGDDGKMQVVTIEYNFENAKEP